MRVWQRATLQPLTSLDVLSSEKRITQLVLSCFFPPSLSAHKQISNNRLLFPVVAPGERTIYANN